MSAVLEPPTTVHQAEDLGPAALPSLPGAFAEAARAGLRLTAVTHPASPEAARLLAKRRHDLKAALRTLGFTVKALEGGYTFQDDKAAAKVDAIAKAVQVLEREAEVLGRILGPG